MVISPRLKGAPVPPIRPRTITAPTSGRRSSVWSGRSGNSTARRAGLALASSDSQTLRWLCGSSSWGETAGFIGTSTSLDPVYIIVDN